MDVFRFLLLGWCFVLTKTTSDEEDFKFPPEGYIKSESGNHDGPRHVNFSLSIESVIRIDATAMEFIVNSYVIQEWEDERLKRDNHHDIVFQDDTDIWTPDIYCLNCRESALGKSGTRVLLRVDVKGKIYHSQPGLLHAACNFNFKKFPFDVQKCHMQFASYSNNNSVVQYKLKGAQFLDRKDLEQFTISKEIVTEEKIVTYMSGNYTVLQVELKFTRQIGFYLIRSFIPTAILVCLSWIIFYVSPEEISSRLSIGITLILSMIFLLGFSDSSIPRVSYVKAIDWYLVVSLILIVLAVLDAIVVFSYLKGESLTETERLEDSRLEKAEHDFNSPKDELVAFAAARDSENGNCQNRKRNSHVENIRLCDGNGTIKKRCSRLKDQHRRKRCVRKIEIISRIAFPTLFVSFSIAYGVYFTSHMHE